MDHSSKLEETVRVASELYQSNKLSEAKHKYLDAASIAIQLSKNRDEIEKLAFQSVARQLVREARDIQNEILIDKSPLPQVPENSQQKVSKTQEIYSILRYFMTVTNSGTPVVSLDLGNLKKTTKLKLNDMLLSGAITAVNQLIMEMLSKPVNSINFEDGILYIKNIENQNFYLVFFADRHSDSFSQKINEFGLTYTLKFNEKIEAAVKTGRSLNDDIDIRDYVKQSFPMVLA